MGRSFQHRRVVRCQALLEAQQGFLAAFHKGFEDEGHELLVAPAHLQQLLYRVELHAGRAEGEGQLGGRLHYRLTRFVSFGAGIGAGRQHPAAYGFQ